MTAAQLVVCGHGTADAYGQHITADAVAQVERRLRDLEPGVEVHEAYVDVQGPTLQDVLAAIDPGARTVIVPFLLAGGYHVHVDIPQVAAERPATVITPALGPDPRLSTMVVERLHRHGATPGSPVILAPAGSSDPRSQADNRAVADRLAMLWGGPVTIGHAAGVDPTIDQAVSAAREAGGPVVIASYLLAPGYFQNKLERQGADLVTAPLAPDVRLIDMVIERFLTAQP